MAFFRAFRATDLRRGFVDDFVVSAGRFSIVVEDGVRTGEFRGLFGYPGFAFPGFGFPGFGFPGFVGVNGSIEGYQQRVLGRLQFEVDGLDVDATAAFRALQLGDTGRFLGLVFADKDTFYGSAGVDVLLGFGGNDQIFGGGGDDLAFGGTGSDQLYGHADDDGLSGGSGRDWLFGGDGDDRLAGGGGNDRMEGGEDDDRLTGGLGQDLLWGDDGADQFLYASVRDSLPGRDRRDTIRDFAVGVDLIDLRPIDANAEARSNQSFEYIGTAAFSDTPGELRFDPGSQRLMGDTDGDGKADFEIGLKGVQALPEADILL